MEETQNTVEKRDGHKRNGCGRAHKYRRGFIKNVQGAAA
jgi:hypothetical protein